MVHFPLGFHENARAEGARVGTKPGTPKPETGKFLFVFRKNRYEKKVRNQMATVGLWRTRTTRALETISLALLKSATPG